MLEYQPQRKLSSWCTAVTRDFCQGLIAETTTFVHACKAEPQRGWPLRIRIRCTHPSNSNPLHSPIEFESAALTHPLYTAALLIHGPTGSAPPDPVAVAPVVDCGSLSPLLPLFESLFQKRPLSRPQPPPPAAAFLSRSPLLDTPAAPWAAPRTTTDPRRRSSAPRDDPTRRRTNSRQRRPAPEPVS